MTIITIDQITPTALEQFQRINARSSDGRTRVIWDSRKLLPWTDPTRPGPVTEDGTIIVPDFNANVLERIKAQIIKAGGERDLRI